MTDYVLESRYRDDRDSRKDRPRQSKQSDSNQGFMERNQERDPKSSNLLLEIKMIESKDGGEEKRGTSSQNDVGERDEDGTHQG